MSVETKPAVRTAGLVAYVVETFAVPIAAQVADDFTAEVAWLLATPLTTGYPVSRGWTGMAAATSTTTTSKAETSAELGVCAPPEVAAAVGRHVIRWGFPSNQR